MMADKIATREAYGAALVKYGATRDFVVLDADLAAATKTGMFKKAYPDRFFDCGIAEGNMMSVAAGIAATGVIPFVSTFAMFAAGRAFEQVRNSIAYPHLNVKICATHAGITVGEDGATHQCNEDIALMRTIPGMTVVNPSDAVEADAAIAAALDHDGPMYIRFGRAPGPTINEGADYSFKLGEGRILAEGDDVTLVATGYMVHLALEARETLAAEGISARVVNIHTIKPLDTALILASAEKTGALVTAEEHSVIGGLGAAVAECLSEGHPAPLERVGVRDTFGKSGTFSALLEKFGLTADGIAEAARRAVARKVR